MCGRPWHVLGSGYLSPRRATVLAYPYANRGTPNSIFWNEHKFVISGKQKYEKMLPISLKSFHIKNYRGIIDTQVDNIPADTQWIFLTGENGFGKTSVLQGIANIQKFLLQKKFHEGLKIDFPEVNFQSNPLSNHVTIEIYVNKTVFPIPSYQGTEDSINKTSNFFKKLIAYGSTRLRISAGSTNEVMDQYSSTQSLFSNEILLTNIEEKFKDWVNEYSQGYQQLEIIFKTLLPRLGKIAVEFDEKDKTRKVKYFETDNEGNSYDEGINFDSLAAGFKNILAMIGDMINRLSKTQSTDNFNDLEGIVIIDEIDLHLHPKYQKLFIQKLTELFPNIQFIVSTHSPIPLLGAPSNSVIINVSRTREEGIKAELLDIDFSVLTPNAILSSPIFGFQELIPESKSDDEMIRSEDTYKEVLFNDQLDKQISEYLTEDNQKELLDLLKEHNL
jgi:predicted ATP-binding protein involved in virulence